MTVQLPENHLGKTRIFHITALENLPSILETGYLYATNHIPCDHCSIANEEVQRTRASKPVPLPPHGVIHDYVPFYFAPRSPMLYVNHKGSIQNARPQEEIVHLVTTAQIIEKAELPFVFYDRHAVKALAQPYNDLEHLNKIDWELFFEPPPGNGGYAAYWHDNPNGSNPKWIGRKEVRQAEFLVHKQLPWQLIAGIATIDKDKAEQVEAILKRYKQKTQVVVKREWYY
ncbi:MAG: DUF4433 domain-containing protein [Pseudomonadota bacterium]|nr:DUF4433 domain-containing protein [Pseudomonadota bacterium]